MKKHRIIRRMIMFCLMWGILTIPVNRMDVQAAEVIATVEGTVLSETTHELLRLSTNDGNMEIKIDSNTDTSECKILLTGEKIKVSVSHGSDGYLHAVKISDIGTTPRVTLDTSTQATVRGTVNAKSGSEILFFDTEYGQMELKWDATTDISGCKVLVAGEKYEIVCARGSDAYMHAMTIRDASTLSGTSSSSALSSLTPAPAAALDSNVVTMTVSGTVAENTKDTLLYLATKDGEMQFVIDSKTDSRDGLMLTPGNKLTVTFYHGSDAYLHAAVIKGTTKNALTATLDSSTQATVTGTVKSGSTEDKLYLDTQQGEMELKLDALQSVTACKVLVKDKKISLTCQRGSDAYMHVTAITGL